MYEEYDDIADRKSKHKDISNDLPEKDSNITIEELRNDEECIFEPNNIEDGRKYIFRSILQRQGQTEFRTKLLVAYEHRCAITRTNAIDTLEAAHIIPYQGTSTNNVNNGLLLRADIHTLFDLGLIAINTKDMTVIVSHRLENTIYSEFQNTLLSPAKIPASCPSKKALDIHRKNSGL
jgi:predicted restriction endonuclease